MVGYIPSGQHRPAERSQHDRKSAAASSGADPAESGDVGEPDTPLEVAGEAAESGQADGPLPDEAVEDIFATLYRKREEWMQQAPK